jgi:hypothetical protein
VKLTQRKKNSFVLTLSEVLVQSWVSLISGSVARHNILVRNMWFAKEATFTATKKALQVF